MVDNGTGGDVASAGDAALAARDFRVSLEHRRDIDDLVAAAVTVRRRATVEGAEIIRNAEALASKIVADAQQEAARLTAEATRLTAEAKQALEAASERDDLADAAHVERVSATLGRLESMASEVHMVLDNAIAEVTDSLAGDVETGSDIASWTDTIPGSQARAAAEARLDRWRERFRQAR
jgi:hypothetical protein